MSVIFSDDELLTRSMQEQRREHYYKLLAARVGVSSDWDLFKAVIRGFCEAVKKP